MPGPVALPEALLTRFRTVSFERLERIDSAWAALTHDAAATDVEENAYRDLHTLKGDARVVGFGDVAVLCQRLEDILNAARVRQYRVHEEVDIVVTMGLQFIGMLLRKKVGGSRTGIDLDGFLVQIDHVLIELAHRSEAPDPDEAPTGRHLRVADAAARVAPAGRQRLSSVATTIYLEHLRATGRTRERLGDAWRVLSRELAELEWVSIAPLLSRHAVAANELAKELGKELVFSFSAEGVSVAAEVLDTLNTAVLHTIRNAVDHGIEAPPQRRAGGKNAAGTIRVEARAIDDAVVVTVSDDGGGVDLDLVRRRAQSLGLLPNGDAGNASDDGLLNLIFHPRFSTRELISEVSGRGVGMDAVRAAVVAVGGSVSIESTPREGTTVTVRVPQARSKLDVHAFRLPRSGLLFAVDRSWKLAGDTTPSGALVDPVMLLELALAGSSERPGSRVLHLSRGDVSLRFLAGPVRAALALRLCRTTRDEPVEIVRVDDEDAILLRPDVLAQTTSPNAFIGTR